MRVCFVLLLLAICANCGWLDIKGGKKDGTKKITSMFDLVTLVRIRSKLHKLRNKVLEQLKLSPEKKAEVENKIKEVGSFKSDHIAPMGDSIEEVNKKNGMANYLYQSDIILTEAQADEIAAGVQGGNVARSKRQAFKDVFYPYTIWEGGVNYYFDHTVDPRVKSVFEKASQIWMNNSCINFRESNEGEYLSVTKRAGCASYVGKIGGVQEIFLGSGCESVGTALHEIGHTLGMFHTQGRHDRDKYVTVYTNNIVPSTLEDFKMESSDTNDNYDAPYDYGDVMHYPGYSNAIDQSKPTIVAKDTNFERTMGSPMVSFTELYVINKHYGCDAICQSKPSAQCKNGGFPHPRDCSKCICPGGYGGDLCDQRPSGCGEVLKAEASFKTLDNTVGNPKLTFSRDDVDKCTYWIEAPAGSKVEVEILSISEGIAVAGCKYGGVEIKAQADQRITGYRFCAKEDVGKKLVSQGNILPVITYNSLKASTISLRYRIAP